MIGKTTATVAIFMLGVFLYGRRYTKLGFALKLSLIRIILLPALTITMLKLFFNLSDIESIVLTIMHGTPVAISLIVLSERYNFYKDIIASTILISSLISVISLNIWIYLLDIFI
ncbi:MAG: hypothetical protein DRN12_02910 [Thermoplasmata archaeon]|nr:MAG: hypothetical protein DRN12_02910 [Thermoplasmata archaeon]